MIMKNALGIALSAVAVLFVVGHAAANPPSRGTSTKFKASGKKARSRATCYALAVASPALRKAEAKFTKQRSKAEYNRRRTHSGQTEARESAVHAFIGEQADALTQTTPTTATSPTTAPATPSTLGPRLFFPTTV